MGIGYRDFQGRVLFVSDRGNIFLRYVKFPSHRGARKENGKETLCN